MALRPRACLVLLCCLGCGSSEMTANGVGADAAELVDVPTVPIDGALAPDAAVLPIDGPPALPDAPAPPDGPALVADVPGALDAASPFGACVVDSDCPNPLSCVFGRCHEACRESRDCPIDQRCVHTQSTDVCLLPQEDGCQLNTDCRLPLACAADHRCRNQCQTVVDCLAGQLCRDHACGDPMSFTADAGAFDAGHLWALSRGRNDYQVTAVDRVSDGCMLAVGSVVGVTLPVSYDATSMTISIGNIQGTPPMPSLGTGRVGGNMATLVRDNTDGLGGACTYRRRDVTELQLFDDDAFTLDVTEQQSEFKSACMNSPASGSCTSTWRWTLRKN